MTVCQRFYPKTFTRELSLPQQDVKRFASADKLAGWGP